MNFGKFVGLIGVSRKGAPVTRPEPEACWLSTLEVSKALHKSGRTTRILLRRAGVKSELVARTGVCACLYWEYKGVMDFLRERVGVLLKEVPAGWMRAREVMNYLDCSRSSLVRMARRGELTPWKVQLQEACKIRRVYLFNRQEVKKVKERIDAELRAKMARMMEASCVCVFAHAAMALATVVDACGTG